MTAHKTLYIVGNGFDMHHGLKTSYQLFAFFLKNHHWEIYEYLTDYYGLPDLDEEKPEDAWNLEWAEFEKALADLDFQEVLDQNSDLAANPASEDFRDRDWHTYQFEMQNIVDMLTKDMFSAFKKFILQVEFPEAIDGKRLNINPTALYISFNYTDTLERYYGVPQENILYIHGKAKDEDAQLVLGHGVDPESFIPKSPEPPKGLSEEELYEWERWQGEQYEYSTAAAEAEILTYYANSYKDTSSIIIEKQAFFDKLSQVEHVVTLGHSLSEVDMPYLAHAVKSVNSDATWSASYHKDGESQTRLDALSGLGIAKEKITTFKLPQIVVG